MVATGPTIKRGQSSGDIWTPWRFIHAVEKKFGPIAIDLAASGADAAKALKFFTPEQDSLSLNWTYYLGDGLGWDNCPYSNIAPWASKHAKQSELGTRTLLLVPGSIGANWYWDYVEPFANVYSVGRMVFDNCFDKEGNLVTTPYPKDLILCHYNKSLPRVPMQRWRW